MKDYSEEQILKAIKGSEGSIEAVAIELGCTYVTAKKYIYKFENTKTAFELETLKLRREAKSTMMRLLKLNSSWAVQAVLSHLAKEEGWFQKEDAMGDMKEMIQEYLRERQQKENLDG